MWNALLWLTISFFYPHPYFFPFRFQKKTSWTIMQVLVLLSTLTLILFWWWQNPGDYEFCLIILLEIRNFQRVEWIWKKSSTMDFDKVQPNVSERSGILKSIDLKSSYLITRKVLVSINTWGYNFKAEDQEGRKEWRKPWTKRVPGIGVNVDVFPNLHLICSLGTL
jgi:hypothetical protein